MIRKIFSIVLVLIGLFFLLCVIALLPTIWGSVVTGIIMLGCFYGAYKIYPKKKKQLKVEAVKQNSVKPQTETYDPYDIPQISGGEIIQEKEEVKSVKTYHIGTPEFKKGADIMLNSFNILKDFISNPEKLNENNIEFLENVRGDLLIEFKEIYDVENKRKSLKLLEDNLSYEIEIFENLIYFCEDQDISWLNLTEYTIEAIDNNFIELTDIVNGKEEDK